MHHPKTLNFTKRALEELKPSEKKLIFKDALTRYLRFVITPSGKKKFAYSRRLPGKTARLFLVGHFPEMSVEQARRKTYELTRQIDEGTDPTDRKDPSTVLTFAKLFDEYVERHAKEHKLSWEEDVKQYRRSLVSWAKKDVKSISRADVRALFEQIGKKRGHCVANRVLALISTILNRGVEWERIPCNVATNIRKFKEQSRDRFLSKEEKKRFFDALSNEQNQDAADVFRLLLATGVRKSNTLAMKWCDVDLQAKEWRVPQTKNGEPHRVALIESAFEVLARREQQRTTSPYVFPGAGRAGHVVDVKRAFVRVCEAAEIEGLVIHDLKRTLASELAMTGASLPLIKDVLGHKDLKSMLPYARVSQESKRKAMERAVADD